MTFKVEPDKLCLLSKQLLSHHVRAKGLQADLQREREEINSVLYGSEFRPPFEGQIRANSDNIETMCRAIVEYLECQGAWLSYFARMATEADNAPLSFAQAEKILEKYDERFILMTRTGGPRRLAEDPNYTDIPFTSPMGLQVQQEKKQEYDQTMMNTYKELLGINTVTRLTTGTDPATGEKLGAGDYGLEAGLTALSFIPFGGLGRLGKAAEGTSHTGLNKIVIDKYATLKKDLSIPGQAHHLNQDAAFKTVIPKDEGMSIKLEGNVFKDVGSPHFNAHKSMEEFWSQFRKGGERYGDMPTNREYTKSLYKSLQDAGLSKSDAFEVAKSAIKQRREYGLTGDMPVPRIPGPMNSLKKYLFEHLP